MSSKLTRTTRIRIEHIADLMRSLQFVRGDTAKRLAAEWGLSHDRVKRLTAAASKIVLAEVTDPERVKPDICELLYRTSHEAAAEKDYNAVAQILRVYADIMGLRNVTTQTKLVIEGERTPAQARQIITELFGSGAMPPSEKKDEPS